MKQLKVIANNYNNENVLLADTLGELQYLYGAANVSFIGGSLIRRGGQGAIQKTLNIINQYLEPKP